MKSSPPRPLYLRLCAILLVITWGVLVALAWTADPVSVTVTAPQPTNPS